MLEEVVLVDVGVGDEVGDEVGLVGMVPVGGV